MSNGNCPIGAEHSKAIEVLEGNEKDVWKAIGAKAPIWVLLMLVSVIGTMIAGLWYYSYSTTNDAKNDRVAIQEKLSAYQTSLTGINPITGEKGLLIRMDKKLDDAISIGSDAKGMIEKHMGIPPSKNNKH